MHDICSRHRVIGYIFELSYVLTKAVYLSHRVTDFSLENGN